MSTAERATAINRISEDLNVENKKEEEVNSSNELTHEDERKPRSLQMRTFCRASALTEEQQVEIRAKASLKE